MTIQRSKERINKTGEVFTPDWLVQEMLDALPVDSFTDPTKTFLDPSCGDGNFLVAILKRKLDAGHPPLRALSTVYGVELMADNTEECRRRLKAIVVEYLPPNPTLLAGVDRILNHNIVNADALTFDYDSWIPMFN